MNGRANAREQILQRLRANPLPEQHLPDDNLTAIQFADPVAQFEQVLESVGGTSVRGTAGQNWYDAVAQLPMMPQAQKIGSAVPGWDRANVDLREIDEPHLLHDLDVWVVRGEFGVAENAAIWVTDQDLRHRAVLFLCQHLVVLLDRQEILHNLHAAYARIEWHAWNFGVFVSGPSKTADIEQSLVIGAHGPRSLTVVLLERP